MSIGFSAGDSHPDPIDVERESVLGAVPSSGSLAVSPLAPPGEEDVVLLWDYDWPGKLHGQPFFRMIHRPAPVELNTVSTAGEMW